MKTNQVPDIGEMLKFWEMKTSILDELAYLLVQFDEFSETEDISIEPIEELKIKIESLGKKEEE